MSGPHWPAAAALAVALAGCHDDNRDTQAPAVETSPASANTVEDTLEVPADGSGASVEGAGAKISVETEGTLAGGDFGNRLGSPFDDNARQAAASAERHALADNAPADGERPAIRHQRPGAPVAQLHRWGRA